MFFGNEQEAIDVIFFLVLGVLPAWLGGKWAYTYSNGNGTWGVMGAAVGLISGLLITALIGTTGVFS